MKKVYKKLSIFGLFTTVLACLLTLFFYKYSIVTVHGESMEPTLKDGQKILVNKLAYKCSSKNTFGCPTPQRGDIVLFRNNTRSSIYIKRVIGIEGDLIEIKDGNVYVNKKSIVVNNNIENHKIIANEKLGNKSYSIFKASINSAHSNYGPYIIPKGKYFLLGDNRKKSNDSRYFGFFNTENEKSRLYGTPIGT